MKGTKEFYDLQNAFEAFIQSKECPIYIGCKIERAAKTAKHFYGNGRLDDLFVAYMAGYMAGRLNYLK